MGKSAKKSATKVDAAPVAVIQSGKKGKRNAENEIEKAVSAKKQKVERDEAVLAKQKVEKKQPKKAASSSSEEDSDDSDSDSEPKVVKKTVAPAAKNGSAVAKKPKVASSSESDSSDSESDDSDVKPVTKTVNGKVPAKTAPAKDSSSSEEDSDSSDEEEEKKVVSQPKKVEKKPVESSESSDDSSSDEDEKKKAVAQPKKAEKKPVESSDSSSDDSSSDEEEKVVKKVETKPAESSDSSDDESSDDDVKTVVKTAPVAATKKKAASSSDSSSEEEDSDSDDDEPKAKKANGTPAVKPVAKQVKADSSSSEESSDDDSDEPAKAQPVKKANVSKESSSSGESSDEDESDEDEKKSLKTPQKKDTDVEMVDAEKSTPTFQKTPKTPATPATGSKTLFMGNLSFSIEDADVHAFFKDVGQVVDIRFNSSQDGVFRGFGHVEFATAEQAQKALELHEQPLLDRPIRLDLANERGERPAFTPRDNSFQKGGRPQGQTAFVRGFDASLGEEEIRSALTKVFEPCGEISRLSIPPDFETGQPKGVAFVDFTDSNALNEALGKDGTELDGGYYLSVKEAKPRGDSAGGSGGRFDRGGSRGRGGRDSGGGRFGGRGGRDSGGGRFGGRGGRDGGRGRGGRGTPYKPSVTAMASGKKTTFGDD